MGNVCKGQRGNALGMVLLGLVVAAVIVALGRGCDEEPATGWLPSSQPAPIPTVTPAAPAPAPMAAQASAVVPEDAPPRGIAALSVHNPCDQPLSMAINFTPAGGTRINEGFFQVAAGARIVPKTRSGAIYLHDKTVYYYTETVATEPVEVGRRDEVVADRQVAMKQVDLDPPAVSTITLECPGATSGRP